jgi:hypothetical protein
MWPIFYGRKLTGLKHIDIQLFMLYLPYLCVLFCGNLYAEWKPFFVLLCVVLLCVVRAGVDLSPNKTTYEHMNIYNLLYTSVNIHLLSLTSKLTIPPYIYMYYKFTPS